MKHSCIFLVCFAISSVLCVENEKPSPYEEEMIIFDTLVPQDGAGYDPRIPPGIPDVFPVEIKATMYVIDISSVDDLRNEYTMHVYFRQQWKDNRLAFNHLETDVKYIHVTDFSKVWKPDTFFVQETEGKLHTIMLPNSFMRIESNGEILFSQRLSLTFFCRMDFRYYPLDKQQCSFTTESYGYKANEIRYLWKNISHAVGLDPDIDMPDFMVVDHKYTSNEMVYQSGRYSHLKVDLTFKRKVGLFMNKLYVPFIILVILSWLSFWIRVKPAPLRLTLILTILFIMLWLESDITHNTPRVSYSTAVDVWTGICLSFVFSTLIQSILVIQLAKKEKHKRKQQHKANIDPEALFGSDGKESRVDPQEKGASLDNNDVAAVSRLIANLGEGNRCHDKIDNFSRIIYPIIFTVFNLIYWPVYCSGN